jgi:hypothetical protein
MGPPSLRTRRPSAGGVRVRARWAMLGAEGGRTCQRLEIALPEPTRVPVIRLYGPG